MDQELRKKNFIVKANLKHNNFFSYDKVIYVNKTLPVTIVCPIHGDFTQPPFSHLVNNACSNCILEKYAKERIGEVYKNNSSEEFEIIEYFDANNCTIRFTKNNLILYNKSYGNIRKGKIRNPYTLSTFGVGYLGIGKFGAERGSKNYKIWQGMLKRCYRQKTMELQPSYKKVTVCEEWHNFQNFAAWFEENYVEGWQLDKDILVKGNKIYSPETCCFVPQEINLLFIKHQNKNNVIGVFASKNNYKATVTKFNRAINLGTFENPEEAFQAYKTAKEEHIKNIADKWKGQISEKVYEAMYMYQVEITD